MKTLFIGSNNKNKINEIKSIFANNNIFFEIKSPYDFNDDSEPIEDGLTFEENSIIKAKYYFDKYNIPCIGEDSGIIIDYFNGLPSIHSKRLLNELNDHDKNEYILQLMKYVKNRKAKFITCICYIDQNGNKHIFKGINEGEIALFQKGDEGFGYDPIFLIPQFNKTEAELGIEYKNLNSHRYKAICEFIKYIKYEENN